MLFLNSNQYLRTFPEIINFQRIYKSNGKVNVDLYRAYSQTPLSRSDIDHTELPANNTISTFNRKHSPGGATTHYTHSERLSLTYYSRG